MSGAGSRGAQDPFAELELVERIETARARQQEAVARAAEAKERGTAAVLSERRELRDDAARRRSLSAFLAAPASQESPHLILDAIVVEEGDSHVR